MSVITPTCFRDEFVSADAVDEFSNGKSVIIDEMQSRVVIDRLKSLGLLKDGIKLETLLDAGCGYGVATALMAKNFNRAIGVDISANQIEKTKEICNSDHIEFKVGRSESLPVPDESIDVISAIFTFQYFDVSLFIKECQRVLKPQGVAIFYFDFLSSLTPLDYDSLPSIVDEIKEMRKTILANSEAINHPDRRCTDGCQALFNSIDWPNKEIIRRKVEITSNLDVVRDFHLCVPSYAKIGTSEVDPVTSTFQKIREIWQIKRSNDKEFKVRSCWDTTLIVLKK